MSPKQRQMVDKLIINAVELVIERAKKTAPKTMKAKRTIDISEVMPINLHQFMIDNNVPDNADFDGYDDGWAPQQIKLSWCIDVPATETTKTDYYRKQCDLNAFRVVYSVLTEQGYKRTGVSSRELRAFKNTTVYDMYVNEESEQLIKYFLLYFTK